MAILIPGIPKDCPDSERYVFERLGRELPDSWIVLHSLGLAGPCPRCPSSPVPPSAAAGDGP